MAKQQIPNSKQNAERSDLCQTANSTACDQRAPPFARIGLTANPPVRSRQSPGASACQLKIGLTPHQSQHRPRIGGAVGGETKFSARTDRRASAASVSRLTKRRFQWRLLGHGSGNKMKARPMLASGSQSKQGAGVVVVDLHIGKSAIFDFAQQLGHAVNKRVRSR